VGDTEVMAASVVDPEVFGRIVDAHIEAVRRYLTRRVGPELAEDLAAETFLRAFATRHIYQPLHPSALPWLYRIATNLVRHHVRDEQRRIEVSGRLAGRATFEAGAERVDDALAAAATVERLSAGFAGLSDDARDVLVLVGIEGLAYAEAATALDLPVGTVRSRLSRARIELRRALSEEPRLALHDSQPLLAVNDSQKGHSRG
jgi:RNA polymerase sigma factor (sigma-70 family)